MANVGRSVKMGARPAGKGARDTSLGSGDKPKGESSEESNEVLRDS